MNLIREHKFITLLVLFCLFYAGFVFWRNNRDTSDHYVNSLYESDERIYNNYLSDGEKKMYDFILDRTLKHKTSEEIKLEEFDCKDYKQCGSFVKAANDAMYVDHPELMNYAGYSWIYRNHTFTLRFHPAYNVTYKDYYGAIRIEMILNGIEKDTKDMTDQEKILYVYDWMGSHNTYDHYFTYTSKNQSIYNVFVKKNAVCAGFAKASQIIFSRIGIKSYIVSGQTSDYHMWNIVEYEGKNYFFDSTIAVGYKRESEHYHDGLRQDKMRGYVMTYPEWYPEISSKNMFDLS